MISEDQVCPWLKQLRTPGPGAEGGPRDGSPRPGIRQGPCPPAPGHQGQEAQGLEGLGCGMKGHLRSETGELPKLSSPPFCLRETVRKKGVF